jgi:hypothetical protein
MRLVPVCSWMLATDQVAEVYVPVRSAAPEPPRLLAQRTRYSRRLSVALPPRATMPAPTSFCESTVTSGAMLSIALQRSRSASSSVVPSSTPSVVPVVVALAACSSEPPQPARAMTASACATSIVVPFKRYFIPTSSFRLSSGSVIRSLPSFGAARDAR